MTNFLTLVWLGAVFIKGVYPLLGYDCGGTSLNITTISLNEVGSCKPPEVEVERTDVKLWLLQYSDYSEIEVTTCRIEIDRTLFHCGMHSHSSVVNQGRQIYLVDMDESACKRMHLTRSIQLTPAATIIGIAVNSTTRRTITLAGSLDNAGSCSGTTYSDPYGTWDGVVATAVVTITLRTFTAPVSLNAEKVILPSGTHCILNEEHCIDGDGNSAFWNSIPNDQCTFNRYDVLYHGHGTMYRPVDKKQPTVYSVTTEDITFALARKSNTRVCGYLLKQTEHPKLFIMEDVGIDSPFRKRKVSVHNVDIFAYINSKFIYVEKHVRTQLRSLYKDVMMQRCELEKQILTNALSTAAILPEKFARAVMKAPGYMAVIAGEVAHLVKCIPVDCTLRKTDNCYIELPVNCHNETYFLTTTSRMIVKSGSQTECNPILPAQYQMEGEWYRFTPHPVPITAPQTLQPSIQPTWEYSPIGNLGQSGIYSMEEVEKLRDRIMFPAEKPALLNNIARGSAGYEVAPGIFSLRGLLDEATVEHIAESAAKRFWNGFEIFGTASAGIIGIVVVFTIIKAVLDTLIHGYTLHTIYGWSFKLIGAIWHSVTSCLISHAYKKQQRERERAEAEDYEEVNFVEDPVVLYDVPRPTPSPVFRMPTVQTDQGTQTDENPDPMYLTMRPATPRQQRQVTNTNV